LNFYLFYIGVNVFLLLLGSEKIHCLNKTYRMNKIVIISIITFIFAIVGTMAWYIINKDDVGMEKKNSMTLKIGERKEFAEIAITLIKILDDSRCPTNLSCVWNGELAVEIMFESENNSKNVNLTTDPSGGLHSANHDCIIGNYNIKIVNVDPQKMADKKIKESDYRVAFSFEKQLN